VEDGLSGAGPRREGARSAGSGRTERSSADPTVADGRKPDLSGFESDFRVRQRSRRCDERLRVYGRISHPAASARLIRCEGDLFCESGARWELGATMQRNSLVVPHDDGDYTMGSAIRRSLSTLTPPRSRAAALFAWIALAVLVSLPARAGEPCEVDTEGKAAGQVAATYGEVLDDAGQVVAYDFRKSAGVLLDAGCESRKCSRTS